MNYNVIYNKDVDLAGLRSGIEQTGATIISVLETLGVITLSSSNTDFVSVAGVVSYEVEKEMTMEPCNDWHRRRINVQQLPIRPLYLPKNQGDNTTVYLVDFGINPSHPELVNANIINLWSYNGDFSDTLGHGTAMASVIVGETLGVAKNSTIKIVKIPYGAGVTNTIILQAFDAVLTDHLLTPSAVKVVNCSWVTLKSEVLDTKIAELQANGLVVVAAAGNTIAAANEYSPVGLDTVLGVGACDTYDRVISWSTGKGSNWGPEVDITAPGVDVYCAQENDTIGTSSGTSLSAAITSGVVTQFIVANPSMTASQIQTAVVDHSMDELLFRNETIYGTTPNRLLQCLFFGGVFTQPNEPEQTDKIFVQKGTSQTFNITFVSPPAARISIEDFKTGRITRVAPEWVSLDTNTNVITFSPTSDVETKRYLVYVEALNSDDVQVAYCRFTVGVYENSPSEISTEDKPEYYTRNSATNTITPALAYCSSGSCPSNCSGYSTKGQGYCACSWTYGSCNSS